MGLLTDLKGRKQVLSVLEKHYSKISILSYVVGIVWFCVLSDRAFNARTYFSENALLPGLVEPEYKNHKLAGDLFTEMESFPERESVPVDWLMSKMSEFGLHAYTQNFTVLVPFANKGGPHTIQGNNVYGILRAPRIAGTEAVVLSVPYLKGNNLGALALMLSFAEHCRKRSYWSKDIIFVVTEKHELGMQAWLNAYHGMPSHYIKSPPLQAHSGSIQAAINLEISSNSIQYFDLLIEGINGQLPNLDLVNMVLKLSRQQGIPASLHTEGFHEHLGDWANSFSSLVSMVMMMFHQASGVPSANHGLFHRYRIESLTLRGLGQGNYQSHKFLKMGRMIEGIYRSLNNLLERFHQSFFFYLLPETSRYVSIGLYMPPFCCLLLGPMLSAIVHWTLAGAEGDSTNRDSSLEKDKSDERPSDEGKETVEEESGVDIEQKVAFSRIPQRMSGVVPVVMVTHLAGFLLHYSPVTCYKVGEVIETVDPLLCALAGTATTFALLLLCPPALSIFQGSSAVEPEDRDRHQRDQHMLKCAALTLLSVLLASLAALNFSLAFFLAVFAVPACLCVAPTQSRLRRVVQVILLLIASPPVILALLSLAFNFIFSVEDKDFVALATVTMDTLYSAALSAIRDANLLGTWCFSIVCLGIVPNWLMFWYLAYQ